MVPKYDIPQQPLGKTGPKIPQLGFGLMGLSAGYSGAPSREDALKVLDHAADTGCTFWDTSDIYIHSCFRFKETGRRDEIFLATNVHAACDKSLKRLGVSTIDLYYIHRPDSSTPIEVTVRAMVELVKAGKVWYLGISECSASTLRRAHAVHPIAAVQIEYSPFSLDIEHNDLLDTCRELGVAIVAYSPLGRGLLTGTWRKFEDLEEGDVRKYMPRFFPENIHKNIELVNKLEALAKAKGVSSSELVLAWVMAQGPDFFPIPGTKRIKYLDQNLSSVKIKLSEVEEAEIRTVVNAAEVEGGRYSDATGATLVFVDTPPLFMSHLRS